MLQPERSYSDNIQGDIPERPEPTARERRDARAVVVSELLREGWSARSIGDALRITDAGGSVADAMAALRR